MKITLILLLLLATIAHGQVVQPKLTHQVILKLDDLQSNDGILNACSLTLDYCLKNQIKSAWGVFNMGNVTSTQKQRLSHYLQAVNDKGESLFEFWNHGLDHSKDKPAGTQEFKGTGYAQQKEHFEQADQNVLRHLGIQMHTFGAPYNASDSVTSKVIAENPAYHVVLFGSLIPRGNKNLINLNQRVNMESATGVVEYSCFIADFTLKKDHYPDLIVMQGHPGKWGEKQLAEFDQIVKYLQSLGYTFILPYAWYQSTQ